MEWFLPSTWPGLLSLPPASAQVLWAGKAKLGWLGSERPGEELAHRRSLAECHRKARGLLRPSLFLLLHGAQQCITSCLMLVKCIRHRTLVMTFKHLSSGKTLLIIKPHEDIEWERQKRGASLHWGSYGRTHVAFLLLGAAGPLRDSEDFACPIPGVC